MEKLSGLKKVLTEMEEELQKYGACDPIKIQEKKRAVVLAKEAAIRWTGDRLHRATEMLLTPDRR